eukprot:m.95820 g.95820  ORF g.95820 m.95820 type:complete len:368 (-) comp8764_c0_seq1:3369-4472(-)
MALRCSVSLRRTASTASKLVPAIDLPKLPPRAAIAEHYRFRPVSKRSAESAKTISLVKKPAHICNIDLAHRIASLCEPLDGVTVLEAFPGPGILTYALAQRGARVKAIQPFPEFLPGNKELESAAGSRVSVYFGDLQKLGLTDGCPPIHELLADATTSSWESGKATVKVIGVPWLGWGVRLALRFIYMMGGREGPFQYSPAELYLLYPYWHAQRFVAQPGDPKYGRVSVLAQAVADVKIIGQFERKEFDPAIPIEREEAQLSLVKFTPKASSNLLDNQILALDYVVRRVLTAKGTKLGNALFPALRTLGPGGDELADLAGLPPDITNPQLLRPKHYVQLANAFVVWPRRPDAAGLVISTGDVESFID